MYAEVSGEWRGKSSHLMIGSDMAALLDFPVSINRDLVGPRKL
jgi:hypothetical protein